jgi:hypothetical protein
MFPGVSIAVFDRIARRLTLRHSTAAPAIRRALGRRW